MCDKIIKLGNSTCYNVHEKNIKDYFKKIGLNVC